MSKILTVAWREFKHTVFTPAFILGAIGVPALIIAVLMFIPLFFRPNITPLEGTIAVVDEDGAVAAAAEIEVSEARMDERVKDVLKAFVDDDALMNAAAQTVVPDVRLAIERAHSSADLEGLKQRVLHGHLLAVVVYPASLTAAEDRQTDANTIAIFIDKNLAPNHVQLIRGAMRDAVVHARVKEAGEDYQTIAALLRQPSTETKTVTPTGEKISLGEAGMMIPAAFMMLIWISTFTSANYLLTTTIEEKSNKVIEVLLSAVSPMQLMTGKILGQALVSAVMLGMYLSVAVAALIVFNLLHTISWLHVIYLVLYFIMAYFMIASMMAGIGSAVNELREAQSLITPAMLVLMIPLMLWFFIQENPNGLLATVTSFIPPLIPFVMILRATTATEPVATWQIVVSLAWGYLAMVGMIWMAAKIFRVGLLMYGKPPSPIELLKWVRYS